MAKWKASGQAVGPVVATDYGALGDGTTDDTAALQAALNAAAATQVGTRLSTVDGTTSVPIRRAVYVPDGTYKVTAGLVKPQGVDLTLSRNAVIRATAPIAGGMLTTAANVLIQHETITGGIWDCNNNADTGLDLKYTANLKLLNVAVWSPKLYGVLMGDSSAPNKGYGTHIRDLTVWRPKGQAIPAGSRGLWLRYITDVKVDGADLMGCATGVRNDGNSNEFHYVHPWNYSGGSLVCFDDAGVDSSYVQCTADTPTSYGWQLQSGASGVRIVNSKAIMSSFTGTDNVAVAVRIEGTAPDVSLYQFGVRGGDSTHRFASTFSGDTTFTAWFGLSEANVVTTTDPNSLHGYPTKATLVLANSSGTANAFEQRNNARTVTSGRLSSSAQMTLNQITHVPLAVKTAAYTIATADPKLAQIDSTGGAFTLTLPSAAAIGAGGEVWIKDVGGALATNAVTLARQGGDQFEDGTTSKALATNRGVWKYYSDGTSRWYAV